MVPRYVVDATLGALNEESADCAMALAGGRMQLATGLLMPVGKLPEKQLRCTADAAGD
jgi:hypothetical protein